MLYRSSLRVASVLSIVHGVMHQIGMMNRPTDASEVALVSAMSSFQSNVMGSLRSYMDFYSGMGLFLTVTLTGFGIILWQLSNTAERNHQAIRPVLLTICLTFLVFAVASVRHFFIAPIIMEASIAALIVLAYFKSRGVA